MAQIVVHHKERGEWSSMYGVVYVKEAGEWRETTKAEMEVLEIRVDKAGNLVADEDVGFGTALPRPDQGQDGSYYVQYSTRGPRASSL